MLSDDESVSDCDDDYILASDSDVDDYLHPDIDGESEIGG